ncbi:DUF1285 domain-containing protein [Pseudidiomarina aquimaris]|uniref:DUF1285 domain-containing protein n=1 Tax=Pseudidiomarina aquimaris TaxID=641841 RepID=A0A432XFD3_9GAMM|nr:DUF1285 domain-containing protein [Pseudidiomarina aquimaris]RUO47356.1 DUF1285 domain-containing protein [Pseudidiomarina aquimaris]|tara:strand:- start:773 stop:1291 length:519 start_codon:yes stop_codon:yes gene_type:complete
MQLQQLLKSLELRNHAPTEQWNPQYCGEIPLHIDANGKWFYQNSPIGRQRLVKLFASVLICENGEHFLVTPVEKVKISVADAPLMIVAWQQIDSEQGKVMQVTTNVDTQYPLSEDYPLVVKDQVPYVQLDHGLRAKVARNVYYQWAELATVDEASQTMRLTSGASSFILGHL